ncbi:hypothetical protein [Oceanicoccus sp. KOV_DT_Chl]|uniref:hypothetical protein n=1 Tax=Oceanicoccus sp. KOV_DT_Chl TaxID=1904639 RepID=UPI000C7CCDFC|nr:hypothetical protein [Oceanicoccus sp. KOV_DT_Chl]
MINDAYVENNRVKRQAWLIIPLALIVIGLITLFGDFEDDGLFSTNPATVVTSTPDGMELDLALVSTSNGQSWQTEWRPPSSQAKQQVTLSLSQYAADYKQLRLQLEVRAEPGSSQRQKLAERLGAALAQYDLGRVEPSAAPPATLAPLDNGVVLLCAEADSKFARRMLATLAPYLGGRVIVRFDAEIPPQTMRLYLSGKLYFNVHGQATFDDVESQQESIDS